MTENNLPVRYKKVLGRGRGDYGNITIQKKVIFDRNGVLGADKKSQGNRKKWKKQRKNSPALLWLLNLDWGVRQETKEQVHPTLWNERGEKQKKKGCAMKGRGWGQRKVQQKPHSTDVVGAALLE